MLDIEILKQSPMFQLSLSSKELFHSNFLYWLSLIDRCKFITLINRLLNTADIDKEWGTNWIVRREYKHFDLCITTGNGNEEIIHLVLENKFKSLPQKEQLDEYYNKTRNSVHILLTLVDEFLCKNDIQNKWAIITYNDLSSAIKQVYREQTGYVADIIKDYTDYIYAIHNLASYWKVERNTPIFNNIDQYRDLRINDIYQKIIYGKLLAAVIAYLNHPEKQIFPLSDPHKIFKLSMSESKGLIFVNSGLTNSQGLLELKVRVNEDTILLIQLQGRQYRRCVEINPGKCSNLKANYEWLCNEAPEAVRDLFSFSDNDHQQPKRPYPEGLSIDKNPYKKHNDKNDKKLDGFCKYGNNFIYQYVKIDKDVTVDTIIKAVADDIRYFLKLADQFGTNIAE